MWSALRRFWLRLRNAVNPSRAERDLEREVQSHLDVLADEYRRRGLSDEEAARAARVALGGVEQAKHRHRDARSFVWLDDLRRDTAYAIRILIRAPAFAAVAILTLALSIGAVTAIFSVVDHVLLRSLPLPHADRLVRLYESNHSAGRLKEDVSPPHAADWRAAATSLELLGLIGGTRVTMTGGSETESLVGMLVGPEFFTITGVTLAAGRPFDASEYTSMANGALGSFSVREQATGDAKVILSHALWLRQFGGDPNAVGRRVQLNGVNAVVQGVMPAGFRMDESAWGISDCWIPHVPSLMSKQRRFRQFMAIARLKPDVSIERARAELNAIAAGLGQQYPRDDGGWTIDVEPLKETLVGESRTTLLVLFGGVTCLLLIACANIANLLLMRAAGRDREVAVRMAIGAGRSRLVRQWLTESVLLALAGGLGGFLVATWAVPALISQAPLGLPRIGDIVVDTRIFVVSVLVSLATGLLCGAAPALGLRKVGVTSLRVSNAVALARQRWLRPALLGAQVGLTIVLLIGAGLMARTLLAVSAQELGFNPDRALTFTVDLRGRGIPSLEGSREFMKELTGRLQKFSGIEAVGVGGVPLQASLTSDFIIEGRPDPLESAINIPTPGYFRALGVERLAGRFFADQDDAEAPAVAIVNRTCARLAWGTTDVVGRHLQTDVKATPMTVVGVVNDVRMSALESSLPPLVFIPAAQSTIATMSSYIVRTTGDPMAAVPIVRDVLRSMDPKLAVMRVETLDERFARAIAPRRFNVWLVGVFSIIALVLALVGVYGLISEAVATRTAEIGVRMALGAGPRHVIRVVAGSTLLIGAVGIAAGLGVAALLTRSLGSMIFGVTPLDPLTMTVVPFLVIVVGTIAALIPARRATRIDPVTALRGE